MNRSGSADLPLFSGAIPPWLFERMVRLSALVTESIIQEYGHTAFLSKLADPFWFQSFGSVLGMDWNSSGVTTAVMAALKKSLNPMAADLGLYVCGGKGKDSLLTPAELLKVADQTGLNGTELVRASKLSAKVDNTAVQDGFQLYLHSFVLSRDGQWTVVQQGMNTQEGQAQARRYHWHSGHFMSYVQEPHTAVCGDNQGQIMNLVSAEAVGAQSGIMAIAAENPDKMLADVRKLVMPAHADVTHKDLNLKRLGAILYLAQEKPPADFADLLLLEGLGPRTLQSLTLVSEVIHGTPSRFQDPARFAFAHGGKNARPYGVPTKVYDQTITMLSTAVQKARIGETDKSAALKKLTLLAQQVEQDYVVSENPEAALDQLKAHERMNAELYGTRSMERRGVPKNGE